MKPVSFSPPVDNNGALVPDYVFTALAIETDSYANSSMVFYPAYKKLAREFSALVLGQTSVDSGLTLKGLRYDLEGLGDRERKILAELAKSENLPTFELIRSISKGNLMWELHNAVTTVLVQENYLRWSAAHIVLYSMGMWRHISIALYLLVSFGLFWIGWVAALCSFILAPLVVMVVASISHDMEQRHWTLTSKGYQVLDEIAQYQKVQEAVANGAHYFSETEKSKSITEWFTTTRRNRFGNRKTRTLTRGD